MKITKHDVEHVARLARLRFTEDQLDLYTEQLNGILSYFDKLQELDTTGVEAATHAVSLSNAYRIDSVKQSLPEEASLQNAPEREHSCFKVPKVIEG
jgi:aspartyl-tRNA(Asn)/glutamyl-tRNA(Gln) amidotransferase subunit C